MYYIDSKLCIASLFVIKWQACDWERLDKSIKFDHFCWKRNQFYMMEANHSNPIYYLKLLYEAAKYITKFDIHPESIYFLSVHCHNFQKWQIFANFWLLFAKLKQMNEIQYLNTVFLQIHIWITGIVFSLIAFILILVLLGKTAIGTYGFQVMRGGSGKDRYRETFWVQVKGGKERIVPRWGWRWASWRAFVRCIDGQSERSLNCGIACPDIFHVEASHSAIDDRPTEQTLPLLAWHYSFVHGRPWGMAISWN